MGVGVCPSVQEVSEAWEVRWPSLPDLGRVGSPTKHSRRSAHQPPTGTPEAPSSTLGQPGTLGALQSLLRLWREREALAGAGGR